MISGVVSLLVARSTARATIEAAQVAANEERAKALDDERKQARAALVRADEGFHIASLRDAASTVRQESAGKARGGLLEASMILGPGIRSPEFEALVQLLGSGSDEDLERASELWPVVQQSIIEELGPARRHCAAIAAYTAPTVAASAR